jgi:hypothetical protein
MGLLQESLAAHLAAGRPLRVLTTVYLGATDRKALDWQVARGARMRVSTDTRRTRLHAKAWLFHRASGTCTASIGSSNLSFDVVIVDEFHHAAASSYRRWLDHLSPQLLLGLTATPERADGLDILHWFDGRIAAELRLWTALDKGHDHQDVGIRNPTPLPTGQRPVAERLMALAG